MKILTKYIILMFFCNSCQNHPTNIENTKLSSNLKNVSYQDTVTLLAYALNIDNIFTCNSDTINLIKLNVKIDKIILVDSVKTTFYIFHFNPVDTNIECDVTFPYVSGFSIDSTGYIVPDILGIKYNKFNTKKSTEEYIQNKLDNFYRYIELNKNNKEASLWLKTKFKIR